MELTPVQVRILGCLVEKERATPQSYPLTLNALLAACNQTTNRFPVVTFGEPTVANALENLRAAKLVRIEYSRSNRADKFHHLLGPALDIDDAELSLLTVLMLRGPQTAAELRSRAERLHPFPDAGALAATLNSLSSRPEPLVVQLEPAAGQKESRWAHLLTGDPPEAPSAATPNRSARSERLDALEAGLAAVRAQLDDLRAQHESLASAIRHQPD